MIRNSTCSEDGTDFVDSSQVSGNTHLLCQLWTLCKKGWAPKIFEFEDTSPSFCCACLNLRSVYFDEPIRLQILSKQVTDTSPNTKNSLRSRRPKVEHAMCQSCSVGNVMSFRNRRFSLVYAEWDSIRALLHKVQFVNQNLCVVDRGAC